MYNIGKQTNSFKCFITPKIHHLRFYNKYMCTIYDICNVIHYELLFTHWTATAIATAATAAAATDNAHLIATKEEEKTYMFHTYIPSQAPHLSWTSLYNIYNIYVYIIYNITIIFHCIYYYMYNTHNHIIAFYVLVLITHNISQIHPYNIYKKESPSPLLLSSSFFFHLLLLPCSSLVVRADCK